MTSNDTEIDLIIERPMQIPIFVEIKSKAMVTKTDLNSLTQLSLDFGKCEAICLSQDPRPKKIEHITVYPWQEGLKYIFKLE